MPKKEVFINFRNTTLKEYIYEIQTPPGWEEFFNIPEVIESIDKISNFLEEEAKNDVEIYPPLPYVMFPLVLTPPENIKVILIGQDPYHTRNVAMGLAFSVKKIAVIPPSLKNIYKELVQEGLLESLPDNGYLVPWAKQGMLMINTACTVLEERPNSHSEIWKDFSNELLQYINKLPQFKVALLWGKFAIDLGNCWFDCEKVVATHPSPFAANKSSKMAPAFLGSNCFKKVNEILEQNGKKAIDYTIKSLPN